MKWRNDNKSTRIVSADYRGTRYPEELVTAKSVGLILSGFCQIALYLL